MVKITLELSKLEIEMFLHCIESALDTKHIPKGKEQIVKEIKKQLSKYL